MTDGAVEIPWEWSAEEPLPEICPGALIPDDPALVEAWLGAADHFGVCDICGQRPSNAMYSADFPVEFCDPCAEALRVRLRGLYFQLGASPALVDNPDLVLCPFCRLRAPTTTVTEPPVPPLKLCESCADEMQAELKEADPKNEKEKESPDD